jgi:hypothetical protein
MVWEIMKSRIKWSEIHTKAQAVEKITEIWNGIGVEVINSLCASFPGRVELMRQAGGETIQPLLSSHSHGVPEGYLCDREHIVPPPPWSDHEDAHLMQLMAEGKLSARQAALHFPRRTEASVRNRWRFLKIVRLNRERANENVDEQQDDTGLNSWRFEDYSWLFEDTS